MDRSRISQWAVAAAATIVVLALTSGGAKTADARTAVDLRAGTYTDASSLAIGGGLVTDLGRGTSWLFNPNLEIVFPDGGNVFAMNGDFNYQFPSGGSLGAYAGGGPALLIADSNTGSSQTDLGLDLIGGMTGRRSSTHPFLQGKAVLSNNSEFVLMGGVRF